jgi:hypothetical protein
MSLVFKQDDIYKRMQVFIEKHSVEIKVDSKVNPLMYLSTTGISIEEALFNVKLNKIQTLKKRFEYLLLRFCCIKLQTKNIITIKDMDYPYHIKVIKG